MTLPFKLVSADSHIAEPPDLWTTRIDQKFRDRAPHMVSRDKGDAYIIDGESNSASLVGLLATKPKYANPETLFGLEGRWTDVPEGAYDPSARAMELDREGIEAEILYTTVGLGLFGLKDLAFRHACFRAFNDWLAGHCAGAPKRLFGVAMIAIDDIDRSVIRQQVEMGVAVRMACLEIMAGNPSNGPPVK